MLTGIQIATLVIFIVMVLINIAYFVLVRKIKTESSDKIIVFPKHTKMWIFILVLFGLTSIVSFILPFCGTDKIFFDVSTVIAILGYLIAPILLFLNVITFSYFVFNKTTKEIYVRNYLKIKHISTDEIHIVISTLGNNNPIIELRKLKDDSKVFAFDINHSSIDEIITEFANLKIKFSGDMNLIEKIFKELGIDETSTKELYYDNAEVKYESHERIKKLSKDKKMELLREYTIRSFKITAISVAATIIILILTLAFLSRGDLTLLLLGLGLLIVVLGLGAYSFLTPILKKSKFNIANNTKNISIEDLIIKRSFATRKSVNTILYTYLMALFFGIIIVAISVGMASTNVKLDPDNADNNIEVTLSSTGASARGSLTSNSQAYYFVTDDKKIAYEVPTMYTKLFSVDELNNQLGNEIKSSNKVSINIDTTKEKAGTYNIQLDDDRGVIENIDVYHVYSLKVMDKTYYTLAASKIRYDEERFLTNLGNYINYGLLGAQGLVAIYVIPTYLKYKKQLDLDNVN